jgi:hypothetical protein
MTILLILAMECFSDSSIAVKLLDSVCMTLLPVQKFSLQVDTFKNSVCAIRTICPSNWIYSSYSDCLPTVAEIHFRKLADALTFSKSKDRSSVREHSDCC